MERVQVRFYSVDRKRDNTPQLTDALSALETGTHPGDREQTLSGDTVVRLERLENKDGFLVGEITKMEEQSQFSEVYEDRLKALSLQGGLGTEVAFAFDPNRSILALQNNISVCGPSRFAAYLRKCNESYRYELSALLREDVWDEFEDGEVTRFYVRFRVPPDFMELEDTNPLLDSAKSMAQIYQFPYITVQMSVGNMKMSLSDAIKEAARDLFNGPVDVKQMRAKIVSDPDEIKLDGTVRKEEVQLNLGDMGPDERYKERVKFVSGCLKRLRL